MENCSRCKSTEIDKMDNFCKICGLGLKKGAASPTTAQLQGDSSGGKPTGILKNGRN